jgi:hypothetical protein
MIDNMQFFFLSPDVLSQEIDQEAVLLDMKSENYFGLNDVGRHTLEMLKNGANLDTLVISLLKIYEVEKVQLENDLRELLKSLLDAGLIHTSC